MVSVSLITTDTVTLEKVIAVLKASLKFSCCWSSPPHATKQQIIQDRLFRLLSILHGMLIIVELIYTIYNNFNNVLILAQSLYGLVVMLEVPVQITLFALQEERLQTVIVQIENYSRQAKPQEKDVIQKYINKCTNIYAVMFGMLTTTFLLAIVEPMFGGHDSYPLVIQYPFTINQQLLRVIVYIHQTLGLYQSFCQVSTSVFYGFLLWFTSTRFEILYNKFRATTKHSDWQMCVKEHQELLMFAREMSMSILYLIVASLGFSTLTLVFAGISMLSKLPMRLKGKFLIVHLGSLVKVFLPSWPADHLMHISSDIGDAAYNSMWYDHGIPSQKILLYTLMRAQRPVTLTVPGLLQALSFQHYASYISTAFSYFTTFRAMLDDED